MSISDLKPTQPRQEPDREPQREEMPPFPTRFGHSKRRMQPQSDGADEGRPAKLDEDPFEDDGGL